MRNNQNRVSLVKKFVCLKKLFVVGLFMGDTVNLIHSLNVPNKNK